MIYLYYDLVCNNHHVFDIVITRHKPTAITGIKTSYLELDDTSITGGFELDEEESKIIVRVYLPIILTKIPSKSKYIANYKVDYNPFEMIIINEASLHVPDLKKVKPFELVTLTVDNRSTIPTTIQYLEQLAIIKD